MIARTSAETSFTFAGVAAAPKPSVSLPGPKDRAGGSTPTANYPIVLLPIRVETRFYQAGNGAAELRVRIFPDRIAADSHEPLLNKTERWAGTEYWRLAWDPEKEDSAWRWISEEFSAPRAAWIIRVMTPTNVDERPSAEPIFPDVKPTSDSSVRSVVTNVLPDRWLVVAYRSKGGSGLFSPGGLHEQVSEVCRVMGAPVKDPLRLSFTPRDTPGDGVVKITDDFAIDVDAAWILDFERAETAGMAVRVPLSPDDFELGFDRLVVVGIKGSISPEETVVRFERLLEAHRYTGGLAFLSQGTPTNITSELPSGFNSHNQADGEFHAERLKPIRGSPGDEIELLRAFGLPLPTQVAVGRPGNLADRLVGTGIHDQEAARAMTNALWPATLGYFLDQMMAPLFNREAGNVPVPRGLRSSLLPEASTTVTRTAIVERAGTGRSLLAPRSYFVQYVKGRGPLLPFRVGRTPYGVLPVSSLARWRPWRSDTGIAAFLPGLLLALRKYWLAQTGNVPRVGGTNDPDADLTAVLGTDASTQEVRLRVALGCDLQQNLNELLGTDAEAWTAARRKIAKQLLADLGYPGLNPRVLNAVFKDWSYLLPISFVTDRVLSETATLGEGDENYIQWIASRTSIQELRDRQTGVGASTLGHPPIQAPLSQLGTLVGGTVVPSTVPGDVARTVGFTQPRAQFTRQAGDPLLGRMLRHAALRQYADIALDLLIQRGLASDEDRLDRELVGIVPGTEARPTVWDWFNTEVPGLTEGETLGHFLLNSPNAAETAPIESYQASLNLLASKPTAELGRLFAETLDVCSHRLDAWITSIATKRLDEMRESLQGTYLGAYGWVEDVRRKISTQRPAGGYIHAPSLGHAATAAVLRSAYLSTSDGKSAPYAVDLSSRRVRRAKWLLDHVRQGQPIGAVLGYLFERGLHDRGRDRFIEPFRTLYPLDSRVTNQAGGSSEQVAPRNVVDGRLLREAWIESQIPFDTDPRLAADVSERDAIESTLSELDDAADAVGDLLTAESVFQFIHGNRGAAAASLDSIANGKRPPEPEVARAPRGGTSLLHRVALVIGSELPVSAWKPVRTPRAIVEPHLNAWVGQVLGDPAKIQCRIEYPDPTEDQPDRRSTKVVTLAEIISDSELAPLDFLALVQRSADEKRTSELNQRVFHAALGDSANLSGVKISHGTDAAWDREGIRSFDEVLEVARTLLAVLSQSRPLRPEDFVAPGAGVAGEGLPAEVERVHDFLTDFLAETQFLGSSIDSIGTKLEHQIVPSAADLNKLRYQLTRASLYGIPGAFPIAQQGTTDDAITKALLAQGNGAYQESLHRLAAAKAASTPAEIYKAILGPEFIFLPKFQLTNVDELDAALQYGPQLVAEAGSAQGAGALAVRRWFLQAARVREPLALWRKLALYVGALGRRSLDFDVVQFPHEVGARWAALSFASEEKRPKAGRLSFALHQPAALNAGEPWAGLLLDEWTELIPNATEVTGLSFQYDAPAAEAPQTILIAVPPAESPVWDLEVLIDIVNETLDLAKIRAVDSQLLGDLGQILPAIYLARNLQDQTISTEFPPPSLEVNASQLARVGVGTKTTLSGGIAQVSQKATNPKGSPP